MKCPNCEYIGKFPEVILHIEDKHEEIVQFCSGETIPLKEEDIGVIIPSKEFSHLYIINENPSQLKQQILDDYEKARELDDIGKNSAYYTYSFNCFNGRHGKRDCVKRDCKCRCHGRGKDE